MRVVGKGIGTMTEEQAREIYSRLVAKYPNFDGLGYENDTDHNGYVLYIGRYPKFRVYIWKASEEPILDFAIRHAGGK